MRLISLIGFRPSAYASRIYRLGEAPRLYLSYLSVARCALAGAHTEYRSAFRGLRAPLFSPYDRPLDLDLLVMGDGSLDCEPLPLPNQG